MGIVKVIGFLIPFVKTLDLAGIRFLVEEYLFMTNRSRTSCDCLLKMMTILQRM